MPLGDITGVAVGCPVENTGKTLNVKVGPTLLGKVLDGLGNPMDGSSLDYETEYKLDRDPPNPLLRRKIDTVMSTGIRAIDGFLTCGIGQRIGIFAGSGVGKSTLLGMIARYSDADVNVIGLIGERGREVREFIENDLGEEGLKKSVLVVATSDQPPLVRLKGAFTATAIAEYFRDKGLKVMLMMDSVTRFAMAQREVGLTIGEPPATKGYTPSVFAMLPRLMERSGNSDKGSITAFYTVLVDGDDFNEPIADAVRGILDGHIVLSRKLAGKNHYPAIDVLASISRLMPQIADEKLKEKASELRDILAVYKDSEDLINIGAYQRGSNPKIDRAIQLIDKINAFLRQGINEYSDYKTTYERILSIG
ncbi:Flagellum-specific ATP synthase FliI [Caloramator australicus RC3]|uniref:Flagellum-specific ATP synthase FliI n=2 Tax=Caloramator TaxID=44258 RepID=I7K4Y1_9CLOT|nr:Flagellum-specific ATP synthase FliI [Caloramator australicus RC3]